MEFEHGSVKLKFTQNTLTAYVSGEIDHHSAKSIREAIDSAMVSYSPEALVIDVSSISFMDSSGLGLVLGRYNKATDGGIVFSLTGATGRIKKMFDLAGLDRIINYKEDEK